MTRLVTIDHGPDRFRVGPWVADDTTAYVALTPAVLKPTEAGVAWCVNRLRGAGYRSIVTAALRDHELGAFLNSGFGVRETLSVLVHDLDPIPPAPPVPLRRARRRDRPDVLALDHAAFEPAWRLDDDGLREALSATPIARFRVAVDSSIAGYAVCGRAGTIGYLQRLAVDPARNGRGIGRALVVDALAWLRRRGAVSAVVNTQQSNGRALHLYQGLGFRPDGLPLTVLSLDLT